VSSDSLDTEWYLHFQFYFFAQTDISYRPPPPAAAGEATRRRRRERE
jgi:hypothetical protein